MSEPLLFGVHAVSAALHHAPHTLTGLWIQVDKQASPRLQPLILLAKAAQVPVQYISKQVLLTQFGDHAHQGVIATHQKIPLQEKDLPAFLETCPAPALILILDELTDPHNLGACLRSADATKVHLVIAPKHHSATLTPLVSKIASGAAETVPFIAVTNLARTLQQLQQRGIWIFGATDKAEKSLWSMDFTGPMALVLGAEGAGLRRLTLAHCDYQFAIPMHGHVSSLNVSVAAGVCLYEILRQRDVGGTALPNYA